MEWGSEDITETDDSEYERSIDRENRLYVESYNYDLSEGMTPMTYNPPPPLRRNRTMMNENFKGGVNNVSRYHQRCVDNKHKMGTRAPVNNKPIREGAVRIFVQSGSRR